MNFAGIALAIVGVAAVVVAVTIANVGMFATTTNNNNNNTNDNALFLFLLCRRCCCSCLGGGGGGGRCGRLLLGQLAMDSLENLVNLGGNLPTDSLDLPRCKAMGMRGRARTHVTKPANTTSTTSTTT